MANNKKRYLTFEVYPDNPEQINAFEWLKMSNTCSGMYIKHDGENGGKDHYHVMLYVDNPVNCKKQGEMLVAESYSKRFGTFDCCILENGEMLYKCRDELPDGKTWETKSVFPIIQGVSDPQSLAHYFLHERYVDIREGKKLYHFEDLKFFGNADRFKKLFDTEDINSNDIIARLTLLARDCTSCNQLLQKAVSIGEWDLIHYIEKNPYFVKTYLLAL